MSASTYHLQQGRSNGKHLKEQIQYVIGHAVQAKLNQPIEISDLVLKGKGT